jgi:hypothetical protein
MTALPTPSPNFGRCEPTFLTARSDLATLGPQVCGVMAKLGTPALPWTREVCDILFEYTSTEDGRLFRFREGIVFTPRQCQKSTLAFAIMIHRALVLSALEQRVVYSAQTGMDARRKFVDDFVPALQRSRLARHLTRVRRSNGNEGIFFGESRIEAISSNEKAGHGRVIDLAVVDEAFADEDDRREQALLPAMLTRGPRTGGSPMLLITSTAGIDTSLYLRRKIDMGRETVISGDDDGVFFCEYSMPDGADLDDESVWWAHHPGLGHLISIEAIRHLRRTMTESEFLRAVANQFVRNEELLIPFDLWQQAKDAVAAPQRPHFSVDINPERTMVSICAADAAGHLELVDHRSGTAWAVERCHHLLKTNPSARLVIDGHGPAGTLLPELERVAGSRARRRIKVVNARELAAASATFYDGVVEGWLHVRPHNDLDFAVAGAKKRMRSDAFTWARNSATVDLSPLVAASLAVWFARTFKPPSPAIH